MNANSTHFLHILNLINICLNVNWNNSVEMKVS